MNIALKNRMRIFLLIQVMEIFGKYFYISNVKFTINGLPGENCCFLTFFSSKKDIKFLHNQFQVSLTCPSVFFAKKCQNLSQFVLEKKYALIFGQFFIPKNNWAVFVQKWSFNNVLLLKNSSLRIILLNALCSVLYPFYGALLITFEDFCSNFNILLLKYVGISIWLPAWECHIICFNPRSRPLPLNMIYFQAEKVFLLIYAAPAKR